MRTSYQLQGISSRKVYHTGSFFRRFQKYNSKIDISPQPPLPMPIPTELKFGFQQRCFEAQTCSNWQGKVANACKQVRFDGKHAYNLRKYTLPPLAPLPILIWRFRCHCRRLEPSTISAILEGMRWYMGVKLCDDFKNYIRKSISRQNRWIFATKMRFGQRAHSYVGLVLAGDFYIF